MNHVIGKMISQILEMQAYDQGHSSGKDEVTTILMGLLHDFEGVFNLLDEMHEASIRRAH